jgi:putative hemolysin
MKNVLLASVAVAVFGLAGCASEDKMMKDDAMMEKEVMTEPVTYEAPPATETMAKEEASSDPMMDLCFEKGGSIGQWAGGDDSTKTCDLPDGNSYALAQLTSYPAFQ